jgi:type IV secretory pathway VirB10-like protein
MKSSHIARAALLLPVLLCGCTHKQKAAQPALAPPIVDAPPSKPDNAPKNLPPPVITVPPPPQPAATNTPPPAPPPKPKPHHKPKPADSDQNIQIASNTPPTSPAVSAAGSFSSGEPADLRKQTNDTITETERGLNGISRALSDQEKKTSAQIREFLKEAKAALTTGDVDGAHTLAQKAKVLLGELRQ